MANYQRKNQISPDKLQEILESGGKLPPQALEVEEAVLGSMLIEEEAVSIAVQALQPDDFYKPANRYIFETFVRLNQGGNPIDLLTVEDDLVKRELLEKVGGSGYLAQLTSAVSSAANIEYYAQIVAEKSLLRKLILNSTELIKEAYDSDTDTYSLLDKAEQKIFDLTNQNLRTAGQSISDVLFQTMNYIVDIRGQDGGLTGVPTSLDLDKWTAGWQKGDLIIIAARPSMGKTAFVLSSARNASLYPDENRRTGIALFSLEMSAQQLVQRLLTMEARVDAQKTRKGQISQSEFEKLVEAAGRLNAASIFIDDTPGISLMELRSKCRRLKQEHDIGMVIVDYLQLMTAGSNHDGSREQEIATISRGLKGLAKELDVPVIALSQLSRQVENRGTSKRPQLSDLRESGSIEQDADVVCFLYRPEYYNIQTYEDGESTAGVAEIIIGKQRNGPVGSVRLHFVKEYARFENFTSINSENAPEFGDEIDVGQNSLTEGSGNGGGNGKGKSGNGGNSSNQSGPAPF